MSVYVESSIEARDDLPALSTHALELIVQLDNKAVQLSAELDASVAALRGRTSVSKTKRKELEALHAVTEMLSERKAQVAVRNYDLLNQNIIMVDLEIKMLEKAMRTNGDSRLLQVIGPSVPPPQPAAAVQQGGRRGRRPEQYDDDQVGPGSDFVVDPNEPVYCTCRQIAFGDMIACDNEECAIEWFHYACVNITHPRSVWLCSDCTRKRRLQAMAMR